MTKWYIIRVNIMLRSEIKTSNGANHDIEIGHVNKQIPIQVRLSKEQENSRKRGKQITENYRLCDRMKTSHFLAKL